MTEAYFEISFEHNGLAYKGRVSPDKKDGKGRYISWHVVLNEIFFGYLSRTGDTWACTEWRPQELVDRAGSKIAEYHTGH